MTSISNILIQLRQVGIMQWAYRPDHARVVLSEIEPEIKRILAEEEIRDMPQQRKTDIEKISAKVTWLADKLPFYGESTLRHDTNTFEYSWMEWANGSIIVRAYRFDKSELSADNFLRSFMRSLQEKNGESMRINIDNNRDIIEKYPVNLSIFSQDYFARVNIFDVDHVQITINLLDINGLQNLIDMFIDSMNSTRTSSLT